MTVPTRRLDHNFTKIELEFYTHGADFVAFIHENYPYPIKVKSYVSADDCDDCVELSDGDLSYRIFHFRTEEQALMFSLRYS